VFGWFQKKTRLPLAPAEEREAVLAKQYPLFREVDAAFHAYLEVVTASPRWDDGRVEQELVRRGVSAGLAEDCVVFGPLAWGREVVEGLGAKYHPLVRVRSILGGSEWEQPLTCEMAYAWARAMIGLYRTPERNEVFQLVSFRSAEVDCLNNTLHAGASESDLREVELEPTPVPLRRRTPAAAPHAEPHYGLNRIMASTA
jgi:hypothetical protein